MTILKPSRIFFHGKITGTRKMLMNLFVVVVNEQEQYRAIPDLGTSLHCIICRTCSTEIQQSDQIITVVQNPMDCIVEKPCSENIRQ